MKTLIILLFMQGCWADQDEVCYTCHSPQMPEVTYCGYTPDEMRNVIDWRIETLGDTLVCSESK